MIIMTVPIVVCILYVCKFWGVKSAATLLLGR